MRFLGLLRADEASEANEPPSRELMEEMGKFIEEVTAAGVLVASDGLKPSSEGKRVKLEDGNVTVIDGPFTESKELVASYALFEVPTIDDAVYWTTRFLKVLGQGDCEIRPIFDPSDFPSDIFTPEMAAQEELIRQQMEKNATR